MLVISTAGLEIVSNPFPLYQSAVVFSHRFTLFMFGHGSSQSKLFPQPNWLRSWSSDSWELIYSSNMNHYMDIQFRDLVPPPPLSKSPLEARHLVDLSSPLAVRVRTFVLGGRTGRNKMFNQLTKDIQSIHNNALKQI